MAGLRIRTTRSPSAGDISSGSGFAREIAVTSAARRSAGRRASILCGSFLVALGIVSLIEALRLKDAWQGAKLMPAALAVTFVALGVGHLVPSSPETAGPAWPAADVGRRVVLMFAVLVAYVAALPYAGFLISTALLVLVLVRALGAYSWAKTLVLTVAIAVASHVVFIYWLGMALPSGPLGV